MRATGYLLLLLLLGSLGYWFAVWNGNEDPERVDPATAHDDPEAGPGLTARSGPMPTDVPAVAPVVDDPAVRLRNRAAETARRRDAQERQAAERAAQAHADSLVGPTIERVVQVDDAELRELGVAELLDYLRGDRYEAITALRAYWKLRDLDVDLEVLREAALAYAQDEDFALRSAALRALGMLGFRPGDEALVVPLVSAESIDERRAAATLLPKFSGELLNDTVAAAMLRLLHDDVPNVVWQLAWDLPTKDLPPEIVARLVEVARTHPDATTRYRVLRGAVCNLDPKTKEVVDYLFENVDTEHRIREFALYGLGAHVPADLRPYVADGLVERMRSTDDANAAYELAEVLVRIGDARHAPALDRLAENPLVPDFRRAQAAEWAKVLRRRTQ